MKTSIIPLAASGAVPPPVYLVSPSDLVEHDDSAPHDRLVEGPVVLGPSLARRSLHILRLWIMEIASLVMGAGLLGAMWATISHYDGQPIPEWPFSINISALMSLLAVAFRLAIISPVAGIMAQQKWPWLSRKSRPLLDLQRIENASNSVMGSTRLLLRGPRVPMVMLGSAILLLALAVGPVTQQSIRTVPCDQAAANESASVAVANCMKGKVRRYGAGQWDLGSNGKGAMLNGLVNPLGNDTAVPVTCSTGNCTFPEHGGITYASLGLCHACMDTSALIQTTNNSSAMVTFNGLNLDIDLNLASGPAENDFSTEKKLFTPDFAAAASNSITNFTVLTVTTGPCSDSPGYASCNNNLGTSMGINRRALAVSCALHPCIQRFKGIVTDGRLIEALVSTSPMSQAMSVPEDIYAFSNYTGLETPCFLENQPYDPKNYSALDKSKYNFIDVIVNGAKVSAPYECVYILDGIYARALWEYLSGGMLAGASNSLLAGTCSNNVDSPGLRCSYGKFWLEKFWGGGAANLTTISDTMAQFASVVTGHFRQNGSSLYAEPQLRSFDEIVGIRRPALGTVHTTTVCVSFAWPWLLWLVVLYVATVTLLVATVLWASSERDQPIWKSSLLPFLLYTVEDPVPVTEMMDEKRLTEWAGRQNARLERQGELGVVRLA